MSLPRAEQPYKHIYPQLDVNADVEILPVLPREPSAPSGVSASAQVDELAESADEVPKVMPPSRALFNVPSYIGGKPLTPRVLPLGHADHAPLPSVDPYILTQGLGFRDLSQPFEPSRYLARPDATLSIYQPFTAMPPSETLDLQASLTKLTKVEYDIDETDLGILGFMNMRYRVTLTADTFEVAMTMLDLSAALLSLKMFQLERRAREASGSLSIDNRRCAVCNWAASTDSNTIVFCDGCDVAVHQDCYGVHSIPEGRWLCRKCEFARGEDVRCVLCPHRAGAFKKTESGYWAHLVCALWTPLVRVPEESPFLEPVRDIHLMEKERWNLHCYVCHEKTGACIQCAAKDCFAAFHPTCAQAAGFFMTSYDHDIGEMLKHQSFLPVYCHRHTPAYAPKGFPVPDLEGARRTLADEEVLATSTTESVFAKPRHPYWRTATKTLVFPHIVVDAVHESLKERTGVELPPEAIEFLCRYWTVKKDSNGGVMFTRRMKDALELAEWAMIRAEQVEEQTHTPEALIEAIDDIIRVISPLPEIQKVASPVSTKMNGKGTRPSSKTDSKIRPAPRGLRANSKTKAREPAMARSSRQQLRTPRRGSAGASEPHPPAPRKKKEAHDKVAQTVAARRVLRSALPKPVRQQGELRKKR